MRKWLILVALVFSFAAATEAEAHWWPRHYNTFYGPGYVYPGYSSYYAAPVYVAPRPYVRYRVVARPIVAAPVVGYGPVYSTYYAPSPYYCGW